MPCVSAIFLLFRQERGSGRAILAHPFLPPGAGVVRRPSAMVSARDAHPPHEDETFCCYLAKQLIVKQLIAKQGFVPGTPAEAHEIAQQSDYALTFTDGYSPVIVGLADRANHYPRQLSGGQEQRVGIARAIVTDPTLLLCDEPTGDLDRKAGDEILDLLQTLNREHGKTIVMVTHDPHAADRARRTLHLEKGTLLEAVTA